mgnify:CR=1 FL=1
MIRFFADIIYLFFFLTLTAPLYPLFEHWNKSGKSHKRSSIALRMILKSFKLCLAMAGTKLVVDGEENIPDDTAVLYVGNHSSYYDILCSYVATGRGMGFFAKKEMEKIPLLSKWMLNVNCLFLDRNNIKEGLKTILAGIEKVRRGVSVWIFPEGTRNKNEQLSDLLPFKEGSLKIAEKSGCPVVPVAIKGTAEVFEKHIPLICPSHVVIEFGEPFIVKELDPENRKFVGAYTREKIAGMLSEMEKENN